MSPAAARTSKSLAPERLSLPPLETTYSAALSDAATPGTGWLNRPRRREIA
jgi:hypothetical protein